MLGLLLPCASSLTDTVFQPNPIQVSTGVTVTCANDDTQPHTATSGENVTPDGKFDSGILAPKGTFDFTFTEAGEYPYFCLLHPNMVGMVMVTPGSGSESTSIGSNLTTSSTMGDNAAGDVAGGLLSGLAEPLQELLGGGDQTAGSSNSGGSGTTTGSSTSSSSSLPSSSGSSRCPDGYHRSPSGDCERVIDTRGMPRCPNGFHRSPDGDCERVR
jgi:hypothetical protein